MLKANRHTDFQGKRSAWMASVLMNVLFTLLLLTPKEANDPKLNFYRIAYGKRGTWVNALLTTCKIPYAKAFENNAALRLMKIY
jgi:hypothetical protein